MGGGEGAAAEPDRIHRALLAGLLSSVGIKGPTPEYSGPRGLKFHLHPGSSLFKGRPKWVMSSELVKTTKLYARCNAAIEPAWLERVGAHLLKRTHSDPHWDEDGQRVMAFERVTLLGLELASGRRVHYGPVNPAESRKIFLAQALVAGEVRLKGPDEDAFLHHNAGVIAEVARMESKLRRGGMLADHDALLAFYDSRVAAGVVCTHSFRTWWKVARGKDATLLNMSLADVLVADSPVPDPAQYPDRVRTPAGTLNLDYAAAPGKASDGVTLVTPLQALARIDPQAGEWLVPGLLVEKITELIRSLPKHVRTTLVPAPDWARRAAEHMLGGITGASRGGNDAEPGTAHSGTAEGGQASGAFLEKLASALSLLSGNQIAASAFDTSRLPEHLRLNYRVVGDDGTTLAEGRDLTRLRSTLAAAFDSSLRAHASGEWVRDTIEDWDFSDLPESVETRVNGIPVLAYPALIDLAASPGASSSWSSTSSARFSTTSLGAKPGAPGGTASRGGPGPGAHKADCAGVALRLLSTPHAARREHLQGVRRLIVNQCRDELERAVRRVEGFDRLALAFATVLSPAEFKRAVWDRAVARSAMADGAHVATAADFRARVLLARRDAEGMVAGVAALYGSIVGVLQRLQLLLETGVPVHAAEAFAEAREHLAGLTPPGFLGDTPDAWIGHYPRYLTAAVRRLEKLTGAGAQRAAARDRAALEVLLPRQTAYAQRIESLRSTDLIDERILEYRWLLEELRVSLFAQELGTAVPVSSQRLDRAWDAIAAAASSAGAANR